MVAFGFVGFLFPFLLVEGVLVVACFLWLWGLFKFDDHCSFGSCGFPLIAFSLLLTVLVVLTCSFWVCLPVPVLVGLYFLVSFFPAMVTGWCCCPWLFCCVYWGCCWCYWGLKCFGFLGVHGSVVLILLLPASFEVSVV